MKGASVRGIGYATGSSCSSTDASAERLPVAGGRCNGAAAIGRVDLVVQRRGLELGQLGWRTGCGSHGRSRGQGNAWLPAIVAAEAFVGAAPCGLCNSESPAPRLCMHYALGAERIGLDWMGSGVSGGERWAAHEGERSGSAHLDAAEAQLVLGFLEVLRF